jgi:hypothetical protein
MSNLHADLEQNVNTDLPGEVQTLTCTFLAVLRAPAKLGTRPIKALGVVLPVLLELKNSPAQSLIYTSFRVSPRETK